MLVTTPPNRLKVLPHNWRGRHQIAKAQVGGLRGLGLGGGVRPNSGCEKLARPERNYDRPNEGQTEHDAPDSENAASEGGCFHGSTLSLDALRVLIVRNHSVIDGSDERRTPGLLPSRTGHIVIPALSIARVQNGRSSLPDG